MTVFDRGDAALKEIQERPDDYDIILMDIQMPGLDGNETTRRMRALGFSKPIIAVTAGAMADDQASCRAAGCSDYISKPIDMAKLLDLVARFVISRRPSLAPRLGLGLTRRTITIINRPKVLNRP